jgi:hypothetical protein
MVVCYPTPFRRRKIMATASPIVSDREWNLHVLGKLSRGEITPEDCAAQLKTAPAVSSKELYQQARRTAHGTVWVPLGYKVEKGSHEASSITLPLKGYKRLIALVESGALAELIANYNSIPLSSSAS